MKQSYKILINRFFSASTVYVEPVVLEYNNGYFYNDAGRNLDLVDYSNVRSFLNNKNNDKVASSYFSFLTSSPMMNLSLLSNPNSNIFLPSPEFKAMYYDDDRLSDSLNSFYNSYVLRGSDFNPSSTRQSSIRNQFLPESEFQFSAYSVSNNYFYWNSATFAPKAPFTNAVLDSEESNRNEETETILSETPTAQENNYFITVLLNKRFTQTNRIAFEVCPSVILKRYSYPVLFSQNISEINRLNDFNKIVVSVDKAQINNIESIENKSKRVFLIEKSDNIIQCFVNPNFVTDEKKEWDYRFSDIYNGTNDLDLSII